MELILLEIVERGVNKRSAFFPFLDPEVGGYSFFTVLVGVMLIGQVGVGFVEYNVHRAHGRRGLQSFGELDIHGENFALLGSDAGEIVVEDFSVAHGALLGIDTDLHFVFSFSDGRHPNFFRNAIFSSRPYFLGEYLWSGSDYTL